MGRTEELLENWADPPADFRGAPFWAWNEKLCPERLCRAIESMHASGMGGFFMHSRHGLKTAYLSDEWFQCVSACIEKARELGMKAYLYDEDRWPSGAAGGFATRGRPEYQLRHLRMRPPGAAVGQHSQRIGTFTVYLDGQGRLESYSRIDDADKSDKGELVAFDSAPSDASGWFNEGTYLDTMNRRAVGEMISLTHSAYADRFGTDFGNVVPAIFTDEPNYGSTVFNPEMHDARLHWSAELPAEFQRRRGYDLCNCLPELMYRPAAGGFSKVRHDYYRTMTELFAENWSQQIGRWCDEHNIALTGHVLAEESLISQVRAVGAAMPHYEHMQWPGIDILTDQFDELNTAKQCSSVAAQLDKQRVLSEMYGCTGWDWPLSGHKVQGDWQYAAGVNLRCPHLTHYSLAGNAKRDFPASIFSHSPWWKYYRVVEDYFARLGVMLTRGKAVRDVLVIHPIESAWGLFGTDPSRVNPTLTQMDNDLPALTYALSDQHYDWAYCLAFFYFYCA